MKIKDNNNTLYYRIYRYISMLFLLYVSGNYFVMQEYSASVIAFFVFEILSFVFFRMDKTCFSKKALFVMTLIALLALSTATNGFSDISSYVAIALQLICALIIAVLIPKEKFKKTFVNTIIFFALVSLAFWIIAQFYPQFARLFHSEVRTDLPLRYYNAYIYVFWEEIGWADTFLSNRNAGIFWEPGCYQAFLNIALLFVLKSDESKMRLKKVMILVLTILTTFSVTGYFILALILLFYKRNKSRALALKLVAVFAIVVGVILIFSTDNSLRNKIVSSDYFLSRLSLDQLAILFQNYKSYLFGYSFTGRNALASTIWNSIIDTGLAIGIPFICLLIYRYYIHCKKEKSILLFFCLLICFSVESLIWRAFFLCFIVYSFDSLMTHQSLDKTQVDVRCRHE